MSLTRWMWPEVSPFCQNFRRDLLQNQVSPDSTVLRSDSAFMYATISTSLFRQSWITAGISPLSSYLRLSGIFMIVVFITNPDKCPEPGMRIQPENQPSGGRACSEKASARREGGKIKN